MAKRTKTFTPHEPVHKRTSIGNPNKTKLKTSSMNKHKRLNKGL